MKRSTGLKALNLLLAVTAAVTMLTFAWRHDAGRLAGLGVVVGICLVVRDDLSAAGRGRT